MAVTPARPMLPETRGALLLPEQAANRTGPAGRSPRHVNLRAAASAAARGRSVTLRCHCIGMALGQSACGLRSGSRRQSCCLPAAGAPPRLLGRPPGRYYPVANSVPATCAVTPSRHLETNLRSTERARCGHHESDPAGHQTAYDERRQVDLVCLQGGIPGSASAACGARVFFETA